MYTYIYSYEARNMTIRIVVNYCPSFSCFSGHVSVHIYTLSIGVLFTFISVVICGDNEMYLNRIILVRFQINIFDDHA